MTGPGGFREVRTAAPGKDVTFDLAGKADGKYTVIAGTFKLSPEDILAFSGKKSYIMNG